METRHGFRLNVEPGKVKLWTRNRTSTLFVSQGVKAYDQKELQHLYRSSAKHAALASRLTKWQTSEVDEERMELGDDLSMATSPSPMDRWMARAYRWLGKATCRTFYLQSLASRMDELVDEADCGTTVLLAAARELDGMMEELHRLRQEAPAQDRTTVIPLLIDSSHRMNAATASYRSAAGLTTQLAEVRRQTKALYYPVPAEPTP